MLTLVLVYCAGVATPIAIAVGYAIWITLQDSQIPHAMGAQEHYFKGPWDRAR
jgi:hypothetical protein